MIKTIYNARMKILIKSLTVYKKRKMSKTDKKQRKKRKYFKKTYIPKKVIKTYNSFTIIEMIGRKIYL
jgi:hypothetical protein